MSKLSAKELLIPARLQLHVYKHRRRWYVSEADTRAMRSFPTRAQAVRFARGKVIEKGGELVVHDGARSSIKIFPGWGSLKVRELETDEQVMKRLTFPGWIPDNEEEE